MQNAPHVVMIQFTGQNMSGPSAALITANEQAIEICREYGAKPIIITPYISEDYTSTQMDVNAWVAGTLKDRALPLLNFNSVWGPGTLLPNSVDSGDGLHLNDTGHLELFRQIPLDYFTPSISTAKLTMPSVSAGLTVPSSPAAVPASTSTFPAGSFSIGFMVKIPSSPTTSIALVAWTTTSGTVARIRVPSSPGAGLVNIDFAQNAAVTTATTASDNSEHHICMTYNSITQAVKIYVDGVLGTSGTGESRDFLTLAIGLRPDLISAATGYRFRNLTIHSTELTAQDVARLATGNVPTTNMWLVASLQDASSRPAGARLQTMFGTAALTTGVAL
jgi:hypothetical protein